MQYHTIIGLEVHLELKTQSKAFCGCSTEFGRPPNTHTCPVCLGLPGSLPVLNRDALFYALRAGLALNCAVSDFTKFDRKNYFYPDLPKNFQISQYDKPLSCNGFLDVELKNGVKRIGIRRVHLEEDTGKLLHKEGANFSLIDFNRSGIPLLEIVSEPDINSPDEAYEYLVQLKAVLEYLDVSDCDMEKGSLRCDANISASTSPRQLGVKTEIKNMNSFKAVRNALDYEAKRQIKILQDGGKIIQETRLWDDNKCVTAPMRSKEEAHDYRYFPEPDLVPFVLDRKEIDGVKRGLPEFPADRRKRFVKECGLGEYDARVLTQDKPLADYFESCVKIYDKPKAIANWLLSDVSAVMNEKQTGIGRLNLPPQNLVEMIKMIEGNVISGKMAKGILRQMTDTGKPAKDIIEEKGITQISDDKALGDAADRVVKENPKAVNDFRNGKKEALIFLVGQLMKHTRGRANPDTANRILREKLEA